MIVSASVVKYVDWEKPTDEVSVVVDVDSSEVNVIRVDGSDVEVSNVDGDDVGLERGKDVVDLVVVVTAFVDDLGSTSVVK